VTAAPLQTKPLMRHGTVTTSDTGLVENQVFNQNEKMQECILLYVLLQHPCPF